MKQVYILICLVFVLYSCKRQDFIHQENFLSAVERQLRDSLSHEDYAKLDFGRAILSQVDSVGLYFLRIPFSGKSIAHDFVLLKTNHEGLIERGKLIHLDSSITIASL